MSTVFERYIFTVQRSTVAPIQIDELLTIDSGRIEFHHRIPVTLLPVGLQLRKQRASPAYSTLQKKEFKLRKTSCDPAKKQRLAYRVAGGGEMADVVVDVARN